MPAIPESTKTSLAQRLSAHARDHWPQLCSVTVRYGGSAVRWGFAIYLASSNGYNDSILPTGTFAGSPQDALDYACDLHLTHSGH